MIHPEMYFEIHLSPVVTRARPWRSSLPSPGVRKGAEGGADQVQGLLGLEVSQWQASPSPATNLL